MSKTNSVSPLRQRMLEDMAARKLKAHTQRSHIYSCKRLAAWLKRSPDTATPDEVRLFQLHLIGRRRVGRAFEPNGKPLAAINVAALRVRGEIACSHIFEHTLTQRTDTVGLAHGELHPE